LTKPLSGKSVLVTRPKEQAGGLIEALEALGSIVLAMPVIEIRPPESFMLLDAALRNLDSYDWVILTSVNGVKAVQARMHELAIPIERLAERRLAAIGPATAAELEKFARKPDLVPEEYVSEAIAAAIAGIDLQPAEFRGPARFLLARADIARKDLANILRAQGGVVDEIAAYRIVRRKGTVDLPPNAPDYITLTSSSAAESTFEMLKENGHEDWMVNSHLVCIGPITSGTVRKMGFVVASEAIEYTVPGLIKALVDHATKEPVHA